MPKLSQNSKNHLLTADKQLQDFFNYLIQYVDFTVIWCYRSELEQERAYWKKQSTKQFPESKHNVMPSQAIDIAPYVNGRMVNGDQPGDIEKICYFAGQVIGVAWQRGISLRWGGNWDGDDIILTDQIFDDLFHYELA